MRAMLLTAHGDSSVLKEQNVDKPALVAGHVLIEVRASSVNPVDVKLRKAELPFSRPLPDILHGDVAGVVAAVASDVTKFKVGDEVYGCAGGVRGAAGGALADYMLADADLLSLKPKKLSFAEAAVLPLVAITAWEALVDKLKVQPGQKLLVHGATGGVGHFAVQLGAYLGAEVYTTISRDVEPGVAELLRRPTFINYKTTSVDSYVAKYTNGEGFDLIFDTVGGANLQNSFRALRPNGAIACIATGGMHDLSPLYLKGGSILSVLMLIPMISGQGRAHHGEILQKVADLVDAGRLKPLIDPKSFSFAEVGAAHDYLESGKATGKISLTR